MILGWGCPMWASGTIAPPTHYCLKGSWYGYMSWVSFPLLTPLYIVYTHFIVQSAIHQMREFLECSNFNRWILNFMAENWVRDEVGGETNKCNIDVEDKECYENNSYRNFKLWLVEEIVIHHQLNIIFHIKRYIQSIFRFYDLYRLSIIPFQLTSF